MNRSSAMELDEMKAAWQELNQRVETQTALNLHLFREGKLDRMRRSLRPLAWGQVVQILFGSACVLFGAGIWSQYRTIPYLFVAGLLVHLSGLSLIALGVMVQILMARIDYAAPVMEIQRRLARVRAVYVRGGLIVGLSWWFLWIPVLMVALAYAGVDLYRHAPEVVWYGTAVGVAGLFGTWLFHRWSRAPGRETLARIVDRQLAGGSLTRAQDTLDEIAQFEQE